MLTVKLRHGAAELPVCTFNGNFVGPVLPRGLHFRRITQDLATNGWKGSNFYDNLTGKSYSILYLISANSDNFRKTYVMQQSMNLCNQNRQIIFWFLCSLKIGFFNSVRLWTKSTRKFFNPSLLYKFLYLDYCK
jgi:hypothetical protein